jgi:hypothetical protein
MEERVVDASEVEGNFEYVHGSVIKISVMAISKFEAEICK